ncbi:peptidoglycan-binding domain-containing protein [Nostoc sp. 'Lobaria pulmonaria (5183) cyanobiont']|uniref:peptidoglycan-binding domain-containing protein n=1 Tax=Nostoc sp. 'Lobaria pulmonaria (5183) cyanobiont' TaxID=1618022 RepID=UPI000CF31A74|nr:peptidoglycan-binding protein [Nostoc sp. 'Lobaria pulmonaria (5183) cyanobiont']AVH70750.1 peptidoglycan-binding protein [Nostoc sp. 'Lobaria pulmonaria (5183) cyanobiont']
MENLAYLHLAFAYEDSTPSELVSLSSLFNKAAAPDWKRLSGRAWKYMMPLALSLSILSAVSSVMALEKGDQGPSVRNLQQNLKTAGFYQASVTQVYDVSTQEAVQRFQKAAGLPVDGIVGGSTLQKLESWQAKKPTNTATQAKKTTAVSAQAKKPSTTSSASSATSKRRNPNYLAKGDEGEDVRTLQERLRVAGFYYGNATGIFGPITEESVKRFQDSYKLSVDGIAGPATLGKLPGVGIGDGEEAPKKVVNRDKLRVGDRGEPVRIVQEQLIQAGYLEGEPNGYYGPYTADAVKRFQAANFLSASGVAGPTTRAKLYSSVNTASKSEFNTLEIQTRLRERGFYKGKLNGVMADDTKKAIKQAQEFYGISLKDLKSGRF